MKKTWNKIVLLGAIAATFTFSACNRNKETEPKITAENAQSLEDNSYSENEFDAVTDIEQGTSDDAFAAKPAGGNKEGQANGLPQCATVTIQPWTPEGTNIMGKKITVNFGTAGCTHNGRTYKGAIITTYTKRYVTPGSVITTTFDSFYVKKANDPDTKYVKLEARKVVVNESQANPNNPNLAVAPIKHRVKVMGSTAGAGDDSFAKLIFPDSKTIEWNTNRLRVWSEGSSTPIVLSDDIFLVSGTHKGKNLNGVTFNAQTVEENALQFKTACWLQGFYRPTKGKLQIASSNHPTIVIDFGSGSCDNDYTVQL